MECISFRLESPGKEYLRETHAVFFNVSKAFDLVRYESLLFKFESDGVVSLLV